MLILTKSVMAMMTSFLLAVIIALILIPFLKKEKAEQSINYYLRKTHHSKEGTPTMGGLIFIIPTIFIMIAFLVLNKITYSTNLLIILFTFIGYAFIGFLDDYLIIKRHNNKGLSQIQKLIMQIIIATFFFYLFLKGDNEPLLWIHSLNLRLDIGFFYGLFILFVLVASSNAVNLTDGLDGLAGGLCAIAFLTFGIITWNTDWLEGYQSMAVFAFTLTGSLLGFLLFNTNPAKIFMGDTGSLALGATIGALAILTRHELLLLLIGFVFVIETLSCILQIIYFKKTGKRLFPMTPLHHSFEKKGMIESDIVKIFWTIGLISAMIALIYGVWL